MGYDWDWKNVGTWGATNPDYRIKIKTTKGPELWIDGVLDNVHGAEDAWRNSFTLHYGAQHWNGQDCKPLSKSARQSNGWRNQYDLWCEFDC